MQFESANISKKDDRAVSDAAEICVIHKAALSDDPARQNSCLTEDDVQDKLPSTVTVPFNSRYILQDTNYSRRFPIASSSPGESAGTEASNGLPMKDTHLCSSATMMCVLCRF